MLKMPYLVRNRAAHFDLMHATSPITALAFPVVKKPKVVTYHDVAALLGRRTDSALHTRLSAPFFLRIGKYADGIIADSCQTKEEMVAHLGIAADKITVVSLGISDMFQSCPSRNRGKSVIGCVGALSRRKGVPYLIRAIQILRADHPGIPVKLVICGKRNPEHARLVSFAAALGLSEVIEFRHSLTDEELVETYNSFDVFVLPSEWEGFGLPILEAQRCGVPVIIREDAHIPAEVSQCCLKASSEEDMAHKMYELLTNTTLRRAMIEEGLEYSQQFTWERTVHETVNVYEEALS